MLLAAVEYARPSTVEDAVRLLSAHDGARALAGGQTLTNVMKARAAAPDVLIDLNGLDELRTTSRAGDGNLELGAMRSEEHTSELQSHSDLVCRLLLEKKKNKK